MNRFPPWIGPDAPAQHELPSLNALEAFDAMRTFLEAYWERGENDSDDVAVLLSNIERGSSTRPEGGTADPAQWEDWIEAIATVTRSKA